MALDPALQARFGAALAYTSQLLGGLVTEKESNPSIASSGVGTVGVDGNGDRVGLAMVNTGGVDLFLTTTAQSAGSTMGIRLVANGGFVSFDCTRDFTLPSRRWYALAASSTGALYVLEMIRDIK
jgi:hypothetical protein